ncbi:MAG: GGDEF domain-containing protein [Candidatus Paceibacterota bacterium]|jgi:diguanylate cyclase (GGDEF)-like protein
MPKRIVAKKSENAVPSSVHGLRALVLRQQDEIKRFIALSDRDFLTKLLSRRGFDREVGVALDAMRAQSRAAHKRHNVPKNLSIVFIDIDNFKWYNDSFGHACGDDVLEQFSVFLQKHFRSTDYLCRWSGDEFMLGLIGASHLQAERTVKHFMRLLDAKRMRLHCIQKGKKQTITVHASFGVASVYDGTTRRPIFDMRKLIDRADVRMYEQKHHHKILWKR